MAAKYRDVDGRKWKNASDALFEFLGEMPDLTEEEHELVFMFTSYTQTPAFNLRAIQRGVDYNGLNALFKHYPVPYRKPKKRRQSVD